MGYTKEQILGFTGGSDKGADIYAASQQHGFNAQDVDTAFGYEPGRAQSWINANITPTPSLNTPPAATTTAPAPTPAATTPAATTTPSLNTPPAATTAPASTATTTAANSNPGNDPMIAMRQIVDRPDFWKEGGTVDMADAMSLYGYAMGGKMDADQVAMATGIPKDKITAWLQRNNLQLGGPRAPYVPSLSNPPQVNPVTQQTQPNETAAYQLVELLRENGAYIQQSRKDAMRVAAGRNLINADFAAEHGQAAAIRAGAPIAINDANTFSRQAINNQDASNQARITSAQLQTSLEQTNAQLAQSDRENVRNVEQNERESVRSNETSRLNQLAQNETSMNLQLLSDSSRERMEQFRVSADINIADRNARSSAFSSMVSSIASIEGNPELNVAQKNEAINRTVGYYEEFLNYQDSLLGQAA